MKVGVVVAFVLIAALGALWAALPLLALRDLKRALESRDAGSVSRLVDFPALRAAVLGHAHTKIESANSGKVLSGVRDVVEDRLADLKIEGLATPDGLIHLVCDARADGSVDTSPVNSSRPCRLKGKLQGFHYSAWTRFDATVLREKGGIMTLTMGNPRGWSFGGHWRLVDLVGD